MKSFYRTNSDESNDYASSHFFYTVSQFKPNQTALLRNVPPAAESPAEKPDTASSPLPPFTLGHVRDGADQGSTK